jgi:RimJ/RimL family protein N-acetyltransferase
MRFEPVAPASSTAPHDGGTTIAVLDTTWTPTAEQVAAGRLISIRDVAAPILASVDLLTEATRLLDAWVEATTVVDDMAIEGTSLWFYVRLHDHGWLQQRILWLLVVDSIVRTVGPSRIEIGSGADPVLEEVARLVAARDGVAFHAAPADPGLSRVGFGLELPAAVASRSPATPTIFQRIGRRVRTVVGSGGADPRSAERAERRGLVAERLERLAAEPERRLLVVLEHARQRVETPDGPRDINPYLGPIVDRLRGGPLDPVEVETKARIDDDVAWSRLVAPDGERLLPASVIWQGGGDPDEGETEPGAEDVDAVADRIAATHAPVVVAGVDLGPLLAAHVATQARNLLPRKRRAVERIRALIRKLHPAGILLADEYHRQDWLIAAAAEGVPVAAVQHGILYPAHNGYVHATRPSTLRLPDRTYVFGRWERDVLVDASVYWPDEVVVGGSPRLDLVRPGAVDREAIRAELGVAPGDRMVVVSGTHGAMQRRFHVPVALSLLVDRPLPGIHLVVKQHPGEGDEGPYRAVVEGVAAARGHAPPPMTLVQSIDLYALLAAADAHVGIYSTVLTEAVMTGTPNLMFGALATADLLGYEAAGVATPVRSGADVLAALDVAAEHPVDHATRQAFLDLHFEPGSASQRIADDLVALLVTGRSRRPTPSVALRPAEPGDEDVLLTWANDPATRAASRDHAQIAPADHHRWLEQRLAAPGEARLWIGEVEGHPIGVVRFERRTPMVVEVAITVAPKARGRGLARPLLDAGIAAARDVFGSVTILADVLPQNRASLALFTGAGFTPLASPTDGASGEPGVVSLALR